MVARNHHASARRRQVDRRQPIVDVGHLAVDLVAQPVIESQVRVDLPVILAVDVEPRAATVLVGPANADLCRARVTEQEVGERVACPLPIDRVELEPKQVATELQMMGSAVDQEVVVHLEALVPARDKGRRIADRTEQTAKRDLGVAHIIRIGGHAMESRCRCEIYSPVRTRLPTRHTQPSKPRFVQHRRAERVCITEGQIAALRRNRAAEPRHERFIQRAGPEGLNVAHSVRCKPAEEVVIR